MMDSRAILSPMTADKLHLRHRIGLAGRVTNLSEGPGLSEQHLAYFSERLEGGVAVLMNDPVVIHQSSQSLRTALTLIDDRGYRTLIRQCEARRVPAIQPLLHVGAHGCAATAFHAAWSPSGMPSGRDQDGSHRLSAAEIEKLLDCYLACAEDAQRLGFAGVEIIAGGDMLHEQFWNPRSNLRTDQWGGCLQGRTCFTRTLIDRLRARLGPEFLIGMTMTSDGGYGTRLRSTELEQVLSCLVQQTDIDYYSFSYSDDEAQLQRFRAIVDDRLFVLTGDLLEPAQMNRVQQQFNVSWLGLDKALLADPYLAEKIQQRQPHRIRPCVSCYQQCHTRVQRDIFISCLVNPGVGNEQSVPERPARVLRPLRLLVVGGGLAGLESARYAAAQGHQVTLAEQQAELGGSWSLAARIPGRQALQSLVRWYQQELEQLGVTVRLNTEVNPVYLAGSVFDRLIIASGADPTLRGFQRRLPNFSELPGLDRRHVYSVEQVLGEQLTLARHSRILILDDIGNWQGLGAALYLSEQGYRVTVVSRHALPAPELCAHPHYDRFVTSAMKAGIRWINDALLMRWYGDGADIYTRQTASTERQPFDGLVLATTLYANRQVERMAVDQGYPYRIAGDCQGSRRAHMAIYEGRKAVQNLEHDSADDGGRDAE